MISQVAAIVYGAGTPAFLLFQAFTAVLLVLAANTSFNAFPRLLAILALDGFMPRQFSFRGDRLAFSWGIIVLATLAAALLIIFRGETHLLIPLYAVGVFIDFTISQSGMIRHWLREQTPGWRRRLSINAFGAILTGVVAIVVTLAKAPPSLIVLLLIPVLVGMMSFIRRQYDGQEEELHVRDDLVIEGAHREQRVVVPVNGINRAVVQAVVFGRTLASDVRAVYVTEDPDAGEELRTRWERQFPGVPLVIVESPYRALIGPVTAYLDVLDLAWPPDKPAPITIVVLPEYVARHWWDRLLYNQSAKRLKAALVGREHTVIADVPYRRGATDLTGTGGREWEADDRRAAAAEGPQAGGSAGPGRAPALALLSLHRSGPARRQARCAPAQDQHRAGVGADRGAFSSGERWHPRRRSASAFRKRRPSRSSAPTRSAPRPMRPRRSCGSSSSQGPARRCFTRCRSQPRFRSCWPSWRSPTARSAAPTRAAAERTPYPRRTSVRWRAWLPPRHC